MQANKTSYQPVLIHPKIGSISEDLTDLFNRLEHYGNSYRQTGGSNPLLVYCAMRKKEFTNFQFGIYKNLDVVRVCNSSNNFVYFSSKVFLKIALGRIKPSILIAGDLKSGLLVALFLKLLNFGRSKIQVSLHGLPSIGRYSKSKRINAIYIKFLTCCFLAVDSVRVVSDSLAEYAQTKLKIKHSKIIISAVPILVPPKFIDKRTAKPVIGVVGRLHSERGIEDVIKILNPLVNANSDVRVLIVGEGELRDLLRSWVESSNFQKQVEIIGGIPLSQLQQYWSQIKILLSAAPSEGYGLAIREALISGAIVVARKSEGSQALYDKFKHGVFLYETNDEALSILRYILGGIENIPIDQNIGLIQREADEISVRRLVRSWHHFT
jgi:glycosyltransferase involved in cell wall biosynthesis